MFRYRMRKLTRHFRSVKFCIRRHLHLGLNDPVDDHDNTLLHLAVKKGDEKEVLSLLRRGADVNATNYENETPLHVAVKRGYPHLIDYLMQNGAIVDIERDDGSTPIHLVKDSPKKLECLERLLAYGADINARDATGNNLLHLVIKATSKNLKLFKKLVQSGANVNNLDFLMNNCLHSIAMSHSITQEETQVVTEDLIAQGIQLNTRNILSETPLHKAACGDNPQLLRILLRSGAKMDMLNDNDENCLDIGVHFKNICSLQVMIKHVLLKKHRGKPVEDKIFENIQSNSYLAFLYQTNEKALNSLKSRKIDVFSDTSIYDVLCADEHDVVNIVKNENTKNVLNNLEHSKFYWEFVDAWNLALEKIKKSDIVDRCDH